MNTDFKHNPIIDVVIFSGGKVEYGTQVSPYLKGPAAAEEEGKVRAHLGTSPVFDYEKFLRVVEKNLGSLRSASTSLENRKCVAQKLTEMSNSRIGEESSFSRIHKFFHKIGQLFSGHGFRTKGEWGLVVAGKMEAAWRETLRCIFVGGGWDHELTKMINDLSADGFKGILNDIVFATIKGSVLRTENSKLLFYNGLNEEKKAIFYKELLARKDWYSQAFDVIDLAEDNEGIKCFITDDLVKKFQDDSHRVIAFYEGAKDKNGWYQRFFYAMIEAAVSRYISNGEYSKIGELFNESLKNVDLVRVDLPEILTQEEIEKLKDNVHLGSRWDWFPRRSKGTD